jgi:hypothetical protein
MEEIGQRNNTGKERINIMDITATYNGASVHIVDIDVEGDNCYITYVDGSSVLKVDKIFLPANSTPYTVATGCTIN